jgi:hypothetical protein
MASISGFPGDKHGPAMESIGDRLKSYAPWSDADSVYFCRFEDLIGPKGGGDMDVQFKVINELTHFLDRPQSASSVEKLCARIWAPKSATFRKGMRGDWKNHFNTEHKEKFKKIAGEYLIRFGYEHDMDW